MRKISILKNPIQDYAWGSRTIIPELMGEPVPVEKPQAELWMGAHPKAPSLVLWDGDWISLPEWIRKDPEGILGETVAKKFSPTPAYDLMNKSEDRRISPVRKLL